MLRSPRTCGVYISSFPYPDKHGDVLKVRAGFCSPLTSDTSSWMRFQGGPYGPTEKQPPATPQYAGGGGFYLDNIGVITRDPPMRRRPS